MAEFIHETDRLILRDWCAEDWPRFWELTNTPNVMRWLGGVADAAGRDAARQRLEDYKRQHGHTFWLLARKEDGGHLSGEILGFCGLKRSNQQGGPIGEMEIGWRLREDSWGQGYAREAALTSLDLAFGRQDVSQVIALTVDANTASWGLMKRIGMRRRKDLDFSSDEFDPEIGTIIAYSVSREEREAAHD